MLSSSTNFLVIHCASETQKHKSNDYFFGCELDKHFWYYFIVNDMMQKCSILVARGAFK